MNEIDDRRSAEIMGWEPVRRKVGDFAYLFLSDTDYIHPDSNSMTLKKHLFSPSTIWDHAGVLIEWGEKKGRPLLIQYVDPADSDIRMCAFGGPNFKYTLIGDKNAHLTPAHITEAFVATFQKMTISDWAEKEFRDNGGDGK